MKGAHRKFLSGVARMEQIEERLVQVLESEVGMEAYVGLLRVCEEHHRNRPHLFRLLAEMPELELAMAFQGMQIGLALALERGIRREEGLDPR